MRHRAEAALAAKALATATVLKLAPPLEIVLAIVLRHGVEEHGLARTIGAVA